jgi:signal transduction histidine kinase
MKNEFINIAAHELRTPIQPILGLSEFIRHKVNDKEREYIDVIIRNAKRLKRLTENILDVTKIESQSLKLNKERFNLNDVITNTIDDIIINKGFFKNTNIKLLYEPKDIFIEADMQQLTRVISSLLNNAIKFTKEGTISIIAENKDSQVFVSVKDTGEGIDPEILPKLFSKFATKSFEGTGLGLFIAKSIVEAHDGKVWAENNHNGKKGATFIFSLPLSNNSTTTIKSSE